MMKLAILSLAAGGCTSFSPHCLPGPASRQGGGLSVRAGPFDGTTFLMSATGPEATGPDFNEGEAADVAGGSVPSPPPPPLLPLPAPSPLSRLQSLNPFRSSDAAKARKAKLLKMGLSAFLSYGFVSNMFYSVSLSLSYYVFTAKTKTSPLMPGQRAAFLAVYSGFFVVNNFLRPVRLGIAAYISPRFENFIVGLQRRLRVNR